MNQKTDIWIVGKPGRFQVTSDHNKPRYKRPAEIARWRKHLVVEIGADFVVTMCDRIYHFDDCHVVGETAPNPVCVFCMHQLSPNPVILANMQKALAAKRAKAG